MSSKDELKQTNIKISSKQRTMSGCEDSTLLIDTILTMTKLLKRSLNKVYPDNNDTKSFSVSLLAMVADLTSIKAEIQDVASETADEMYELEMKAKELKGENNAELDKE